MVQVQDQCDPICCLAPGVVQYTDGHGEARGVLTNYGSQGVEGESCAAQVVVGAVG